MESREMITMELKMKATDNRVRINYEKDGYISKEGGWRRVSWRMVSVRMLSNRKRKHLFKHLGSLFSP